MSSSTERGRDTERSWAGGMPACLPRSPHRSCKQPGSCLLQVLQDQGQQQALGTAPPPPTPGGQGLCRTDTEGGFLGRAKDLRLWGNGLAFQPYKWPPGPTQGHGCPTARLPGGRATLALGRLGVTERPLGMAGTPQTLQEHDEKPFPF